MLLVFSITPPEKNIRHNPGAAGDCAMVNRRGGEKACAMVPWKYSEQKHSLRFVTR